MFASLTMQALAACLSHTPLQGHFDPASDILAEVSEAVAGLRARVASFDPELVFLFAPDHFNGFFYDLMPQFCIGAAAEAIGDFGSLAGTVNVAGAAATDCARACIDAGIDVAVSLRMRLDHGFSGPLKDLFGSLATPPLVPIFINAVAPPLASCARARFLGEAVGRHAASLGKRVLFLGSGGLSHEPPVPRLETAPPEVVGRLIDGRDPPASVTEARLERVIGAARGLTEADPRFKPLNPDWDRQFLTLAERGEASVFDALRDEEIEREAGNSAHEVRTWIAALAAIGSLGRYKLHNHYYRPIPEWIAGFGVAWAEPAVS